MGVSAPPDQRARIIDAALHLMSEHGSASATMRQLATAGDLNVATLYHYFPSKADLLRSVMTERRYGERLAQEKPPLDAAMTAHDRLVALIGCLWANTLEEEAVWRLLIGEAIHGEADATTSVREVVDALAVTIRRWLDDSFPEIPGDHAALSRVILGQVFALVVEHLALGGVSTSAARERAEELATLVVP